MTMVRYSYTLPSGERVYAKGVSVNDDTGEIQDVLDQIPLAFKRSKVPLELLRRVRDGTSIYMDGILIELRQDGDLAADSLAVSIVKTLYERLRPAEKQAFLRLIGKE